MGSLSRSFFSKAHRDVILGHSLQGMVAYYLKPNDEDLKAAIDNYTIWIDDQIANVTRTVIQEAEKG